MVFLEHSDESWKISPVSKELNSEFSGVVDIEGLWHEGRARASAVGPARPLKPWTENDAIKIQLCMRWMKVRCHQLKTARGTKAEHSYRLKHAIEKEANEYIANGHVLAACIRLGVLYKADKLNAYVGLAVKKLSRRFDRRSCRYMDTERVVVLKRSIVRIEPIAEDVFT